MKHFLFVVCTFLSIQSAFAASTCSDSHLQTLINQSERQADFFAHRRPDIRTVAQITPPTHAEKVKILHALGIKDAKSLAATTEIALKDYLVRKSHFERLRLSTSYSQADSDVLIKLETATHDALKRFSPTESNSIRKVTFADVKGERLVSQSAAGLFSEAHSKLEKLCTPASKIPVMAR